MLILTEEGLIAARDYLGRTPIVIGRNADGYALSSETSAFPNLGYERVRDLGPGEIVRVTAEGIEVLQAPPSASRSVLSSGSTMDSRHRTISASTPRLRARPAAALLAARMTLRPTGCAVSPTRAWVLPSDTPKVTASPTVAPC